VKTLPLTALLCLSMTPYVEPHTDFGMCECVSIVCQVCPNPDTTVDLRWCRERGFSYEWNGSEWAL